MAHSSKKVIKEAAALESEDRDSALKGGADPSTCVALEASLVADSWCVQSCGAEPPNCPPSTCKCDGPNPSPSPVPGVAAAPAEDDALKLSVEALQKRVESLETALAAASRVHGAKGPGRVM